MPSRFIYTPLEVDQYYHIFNQGNNREKIFFADRNYFYFIRQYKKYMLSSVNTYAYVLIPNHFHFIIKVTNSNISGQFRKLFQSYALAINKQEGRSGSLFSKVFKRVKITDETYFKHLTYYIHHNPVKHQMEKDFRKYPYSSYDELISNSETFLLRQDIFDIFGSRQDFIDYHNFKFDRRNTDGFEFENV